MAEINETRNRNPMNSKIVFLNIVLALFVIAGLLALGTFTGSVNAMVFVSFGLAFLAASFLP